MTQTGAFVGTMEYMSPEQALGKNLDQRSDLFALGLICYEMLTGKMPFQAESALASLIKRTQERADPVTSYDPAIPAALSGIVSKCLENNANLRYESAAAILEDLKTWKGKRAASNLRFHANVPSAGLSGLWIAIAVGILVIALGATGFFVGKRFLGSKATQSVSGAPISLAIMPFYNDSADPSLDWAGFESFRHAQQRYRSIKADSHGVSGPIAPGAARSENIGAITGGCGNTTTSRRVCKTPIRSFSVSLQRLGIKYGLTPQF